ncbi:MAG: TauD/TfdA family dioxygenase, partial [Gammaproteobacteria bacterium]
MTTMRELEVRPAARDFVAQVRGVDLARVADAATVAAIRAAWTRHPVLVFPDQQLDPARLQSFCAALGPFGHDPYVQPMDGFEHVIEVRREAGETAPIFGSLWHSDWSFQATPPSATVLYGAVVPPLGGDTVFADGYAAWEGLSPVMQGLLAGLRGVHSAAPSYGPRGLFARDDATRSMRIVVSAEAERTETHPLVRRHPASGRRALFVNHVYTIGIEGLRAEESRALLEFLFKHMTRPEFVHRHRWHPGTLEIGR